MAINNAAINPKEFGVFIAEETTVGTFPTSGFQGVEVESISMPTFNDLRVMEQRSGSTGRVVNSGDLLRHEPGAVHEISISGVLTVENAPILLENAFGKEISGSTGGGETANFITLATGYEHSAFDFGATSSGGQNTIAVLIQGHSSVNSTYKIPGVVITSLVLSANSQENGGRFNFEMTGQTRCQVAAVPVAQLSTGVTDYSANFVYMGDFTQDVKVYNKDVILDQFSLNVENPVQFLGNDASSFDGNPEKYVRGVPNLNVTANCVVKFDDNTNEFFADSRVLTVSSTNGLFLSNNSTFASASAFAINIPKVIIEEVAYDEGDFLKLNATLKMVDGGSGNLIMVRKPA
tara:strand:+ start:2637 stop:3683 length:1047 start_codon:yes stop_codon:yes gene_type:complete